MTHSQQRPQVQLDWANISYRSIMRGIVYVMLLVGAGGLVYYLNAERRVTPEEAALLEINRAERMVREAQTTTDATLQRAVESAEKLLASARLSYDRGDYVEAKAAAQQSQSFSQKILEGTAGESFTAKIYKYEGDVKIKRARQFVWDNIASNIALRVGDQIKTASNGSAQIIYFDGTITTIKPGSLLEIRELSEDPATKVRKVREQLNFGGVSAAMPGANVAGSYHEVATDSASARATSKARFDVDYDAGTRKTSTEVQSGTTEVHTADKTVTVQPLERVEVAQDQTVSRRKVPPAPALLDPQDQRVFAAQSPEAAATTMQWSGVDGAARYRLQIARTSLFGEMLLDKSDLHGTSLQVKGLQAGGYYWRVSCIDASNVESTFSEARKFKIGGAEERHTDDTIPPPLTIGDFLPSGHLVIINGKTEPGATLSVDGQAVDVYDDGSFTAVVRLKKDGMNQLAIVAQDPAGNTTRMNRSVFVDTF